VCVDKTYWLLSSLLINYKVCTWHQLPKTTTLETDTLPVRSSLHQIWICRMDRGSSRTPATATGQSASRPCSRVSTRPSASRNFSRCSRIHRCSQPPFSPSTQTCAIKFCKHKRYVHLYSASTAASVALSPQTGNAFSLGHSLSPCSQTLTCSHTAVRSPSLPFYGVHLCNPCKFMDYYSLTEPMEGWVGLVDPYWQFTHKVATCQPYIGRQLLIKCWLKAKCCSNHHRLPVIYN